VVGSHGQESARAGGEEPVEVFADAVNAATATTALPDGCRKSPGGSAMKEEFVAVGLVGNTPNFPCSVSEPRNI
jgi:hypothetical protein